MSPYDPNQLDGNDSVILGATDDTAIGNVGDSLKNAITLRNANNFFPAPDTLITVSSAGEQDVARMDSDGNLMARAPILTDEGSFRDDFSGTSLSVDLTGAVDFTNNSDTITGTGTLFLTELNQDKYVKLKTHATTYWVKILSVISDTEAKLYEPYGGATASGTGEKGNWYVTIVGSGTATCATSLLTLAVGTDAGAVANVYKEIDYGPMRMVVRAKANALKTNQIIYLGYRDSVATPTNLAYFLIDTTTNTTIKAVTQSAATVDDIETTTLTLPNSGTTTSYHNYCVDVKLDQVAFFIDGVQVAVHRKHIPDPYASMHIGISIENYSGATPASNSVIVDFMYCYNLNQVEVQNTFSASPVYVALQEDIHYLSGGITTTSTTADQVIVSTVVPADKVLCIVGYSVAAAGIAGDVKIGKNTVTTPPSGPGTVDGVIFRAFRSVGYSAANSGREFETFANPRRIAFGGDTVKITVTPSATTSSFWFATLDYILR